MKVIGLSGSPIKDGNTETAIKAVLQGARGRGAEVESIRLYGVEIAPCDACDACVAGHGCVIRDGATAILERLEGAQAVVFGSPVYWFAVSGVLKNLVDRTYYAAHHKSLAGKRIAVILVQHSSGAEDALGLFRCWIGEQDCTMLKPVVVNTAGKPGVVAGDAGLLCRLRELGEQLVSGS